MVTAPPTPPQKSSDEPEMYSLPITPGLYKKLEALAKAKGQNVTEYIVDSLSLRQWFDKQLADGGSIIARPAHGEQRLIKAPR